MFWFCPTLYGYRSEIFETMSQIVGTAIKPVSIKALFGTLPLSVRCSGCKADFVAFVSLLARSRILMHWKSSAPPTHSLWINYIFNFHQTGKN